MNQYLTLAHAIAAACVGQASLVIDAKPSTHRGWREGIRPGFKPDLSNAVATAPGRWRDVVARGRRGGGAGSPPRSRTRGTSHGLDVLGGGDALAHAVQPVRARSR